MLTPDYLRGRPLLRPSSALDSFVLSFVWWSGKSRRDRTEFKWLCHKSCRAKNLPIFYKFLTVFFALTRSPTVCKSLLLLHYWNLKNTPPFCGVNALLVCSTILFNIRPDFSVVAYADDIALFGCLSNPYTAVRKIERTLTHLTDNLT